MLGDEAVAFDEKHKERENEMKSVGNICRWFSLLDTDCCNVSCVYLLSSPNSPGLVNWPQYDMQKQEYMELGLTQMVREKLKNSRVHFATVTLPQKLDQLAAVAAKPGKWSLLFDLLFYRFEHLYAYSPKLMLILLCFRIDLLCFFRVCFWHVLFNIAVIKINHFIAKKGNVSLVKTPWWHIL